MKKRKLIFSIQILVILLGVSSISFAQISSIGKDWGGLTQYISGSVAQDSIYVFFSSTASPKLGSLKVAFSPSLPSSDFKWSKYHDEIINPANRFVEFATESGVAESSQINLARGGYKVVAKRISDDSVATYYCWVMIDELIITSLDVYNGCDFLEVIAKTTPSALDLRNGDVFRYWDFKSNPSSHREINTYGNDYFKTIAWHADNSLVSVPTDPLLTLTIDEPAPLYDSKYDIQITNPFGRLLRDTTEMLPAKAPKADFQVYVFEDGAWSDGGLSPNGEAPLELKFDTKSINTDSIYWQILNDDDLFKKGGDSIICRDGYLFSEGIGVIPSKKLVPGRFPIQHIAVKVSSGCRDTMSIYVDVDSSGIKSDAIPNVFSPNGDGINEYFKIKEPDLSVTSIKSFHVFIFSRGGQRVYEYSGDPKTWEGWDGKLYGKSKDAPDGVYFYIIEAVGWDNKKYKGGVYKGFVHLLRGK